MPSAEEIWQNMLCRRILAYWLGHPAAKDSTDGIRMWWLSGSDPGFESVTSAELKSALDLLVVNGWVTVRGRNEQDKVYALNRAEMESIARFVYARELHGQGE